MGGEARRRRGGGGGGKYASLRVDGMNGHFARRISCAQRMRSSFCCSAGVCGVGNFITARGMSALCRRRRKNARPISRSFAMGRGEESRAEERTGEERRREEILKKSTDISISEFKRDAPASSCLFQQPPLACALHPRQKAEPQHSARAGGGAAQGRPPASPAEPSTCI